MGVLIVGGGLAGLTSAIKIKAADPSTHVTVINNNPVGGNSPISGWRIRARQSGKGNAPEKEIMSLLAGKNEFDIRKTERFAKTAISELHYWLNIHNDKQIGKYSCNKPLFYQDQPEWFGPQLGQGNTGYVMQWFLDLAKKMGINFTEGKVIRLIMAKGSIAEVAAIVKNIGLCRIREEIYVIANGSSCGSLYASTNRFIHDSAHELAWKAGIPMTGSTVYMFHPFGRCLPDGSNLPGCYQTDLLSQAKIILSDGSTDKETMDLLRNHKAHYYFDEICKKFISYGGIVRLLFPDNKVCNAKVSVHYSGLGIKTTDGICVSEVDNLLALGDASNLGIWNNYQPRLPGFALLKCLVDARLSQKYINNLSRSEKRRALEIYPISNYNMPKETISNEALKKINTRYLFALVYGNKDSFSSTCTKWVTDLEKLPATDTVTDMSKGIAKIHQSEKSYHDIKEPLLLHNRNINNNLNCV